MSKEADATKKPRVFISYAHADGYDFVRRLAFALSLYMDVFWDRHLEAGDYPEQLLKEIENREFFLLILTPFSIRENGWCQKELRHAEQLHNLPNRTILLAKPFDSLMKSDFEDYLIDKYTYGDFASDFEAGFRRITGLILKEERSSWEYLGRDPNGNTVMMSLVSGRVPGIVAKSVAEWALVKKLWAFFDALLSSLKMPIMRGTPSTAIGVIQQLPFIDQQLLRDRNFAAHYLVQRIMEVVRLYEILREIPDRDHFNTSKHVHLILAQIKALLEFQFIASRDFLELMAIRTTYGADIVDKVRELVLDHARRSRYLY
ncbi:MAG: toll/interleukin-1 receptor domain-containing protein [Anaerolineae bacterium]|nr:toll/interleukin-1 receptor domain-containing protein [Anaerolineae bacterium]